MQSESDFLSECLDLQYAPFDDGSHVRRGLAKVKGLTLENSFRGYFTAGSESARLRIEPGDHLRLECDVKTPPSPCEALAKNHDLPGNVRFAATHGRMTLLADTQLDGEWHLAASFREIADGLHEALGRPRHDGTTTRPIAAEHVREVLEAAKWEEDAVVPLDEGWELRPRVRGETTPVRLTADGGELRVGHVVLDGWLDRCESAVAAQALRFNAELRHCRLAVCGKAIVAETRLHAGLVKPSWLVMAARAVATASRHVRTTLEILARQTDVARHCESMFFDRR